MTQINQYKKLVIALLMCSASYMQTTYASWTEIFNQNDTLELISSYLWQHKSTALAIAAGSAAAYGWYTYNQALHWNWNLINIKQPTFTTKDGSPFLIGTATASEQVEGGCTNSHYTLPEILGTFKKPAGTACNHWHTYKDDIKKMAECGFTAYRFSVSWDKIQPTQNNFDKTALQHYKDVCKTCRDYNIQPMITLYHYSEPLWFFKKGSFGYKKNIKYFVEFCQRVAQELGEYNPMWLTFNSVSGVGKRVSENLIQVKKANSAIFDDEDKVERPKRQLMVDVMQNTCQAHVEVYNAIKSQEASKDNRVGILKAIYQIDPWNPLNPIDMISCFIKRKLADDCIYDFFTKGHFYVNIPFLAQADYKNPDAPKSLDFIGLNYYSHSYISNGKFRHVGNEITMHHGEWVLYPEGMYRALMTLKKSISDKLGIPIYITENGIGLDENLEKTNPEEFSKRRELFFKRYFYAIEQAMQQGCDIRGYINWSFMDNWSWGRFNRRYGVYKTDYNSPELTRTVRNDAGTTYFLDIAKKHKGQQS